MRYCCTRYWYNLSCTLYSCSHGTKIESSRPCDQRCDFWCTRYVLIRKRPGDEERRHSRTLSTLTCWLRCYCCKSLLGASLGATRNKAAAAEWPRDMPSSTKHDFPSAMRMVSKELSVRSRTSTTKQEPSFHPELK